MRAPKIAALAALVGASFVSAAMAQPMAKADYAVARKNIESDFRTARVGCEPMPANVKDICLADVTGREGVALAELEAAYQPGAKALEGVRIAKVQAVYSLARQRCDDKAGALRDGCVRDADAANVASLAGEAPVPVKTAPPGVVGSSQR